MPNFLKKVVVITGASSGIGEAMAQAFADSGAQLALLARRLDRLEEIATKLRGQGKSVLPLQCDVTQDGDLEKAFKQIIERYGSIDVVIANAGFGVVGEAAELSLEDYRRQFETNVFGVLRTVKVAVPELKKTRGRLAVVGSVNGYVALPGNAPYAMSKFAVRALCVSLYHELKKSGVSVTHIAPGFVVSEIRKVSNAGKFQVQAKDPVPDWIQMPSDVAARKIVKAIFYRKRERILTAHGYWVVFLQRHFPSLVATLLQVLGVKARGEPRR